MPTCINAWPSHVHTSTCHSHVFRDANMTPTHARTQTRGYVHAHANKCYVLNYNCKLYAKYIYMVFLQTCINFVRNFYDTCKPVRSGSHKWMMFLTLSVGTWIFGVSTVSFISFFVCFLDLTHQRISMTPFVSIIFVSLGVHHLAYAYNVCLVTYIVSQKNSAKRHIYV